MDAECMSAADLLPPTPAGERSRHTARDLTDGPGPPTPTATALHLAEVTMHPYLCASRLCDHTYGPAATVRGITLSGV